MNVRHLKWAAVLLLLISQAHAQPFSEGEHYLKLEAPLPISGAAPKEVWSFFKYTCPGCYRFHPHLEAWRSRLGPEVNFQAVAVFQPELYSQAWYAADLLELDDGFHETIYHAVHVERKPLRTLPELAALAVEHGDEKRQFTAMAESFSVAAKIREGNQRAAQAQVPGTPVLVINGEYLITGTMLNSYQQMLEVADYLLAQG